ncbi:MAG TPA: ABC transporter ATP-binding protein [Candidatus Methanofastidiosa archaeon]|nr:ABC transporter ATP-binding protein [Candidatus Methanofastidiosa archaeon]
MNCSVDALSVTFSIGSARVKAASDVSFSIKDEALALVGETGCGKSVVAHAMMGVLPSNAEVRGTMDLDGTRCELSYGRYPRHVRGRSISLLMQNPLLSMDPLMKVGDHIIEALNRGQRGDTKKDRKVALEELAEIGFEDPKKIYSSYPHELSGGMIQRAALCVATAQSPDMLIADEPTKSLDAKTAQDTIAMLVNRKQHGIRSMLVITHDLSLVETLCEKVAVMYCGKIVEMGDVRDVFEDPHHPYTRDFLHSHPLKEFSAIPGMTPSMVDVPKGCAYHPRCRIADMPCTTDSPQMKERTGRHVRCHRY